MNKKYRFYEKEKGVYVFAEDVEVDGNVYSRTAKVVSEKELTTFLMGDQMRTEEEVSVDEPIVFSCPTQKKTRTFLSNIQYQAIRKIYDKTDPLLNSVTLGDILNVDRSCISKIAKHPEKTGTRKGQPVELTEKVAYWAICAYRLRAVSPYDIAQLLAVNSRLLSSIVERAPAYPVYLNDEAKRAKERFDKEHPNAER